MTKRGLLWISWSKGKSVIPTDLKWDPIREYGLEQGLVDVKVAAKNQEATRLAQQVIKECVNLARVKGIDLDEQAIEERISIKFPY